MVIAEHSAQVGDSLEPSFTDEQLGMGTLTDYGGNVVVKASVDAQQKAQMGVQV